MIDITFTVKGIIASIIFWKSKKDQAVIGAWSELRDHLYDFPQKPASKEGTVISKEDTSAYNAQMETWGSKKNDLLIELLDKMANSLDYYFDKVLLKRGSYTPQQYGDLETFQIINMAGFADILVGNRSLPIHIVEIPSTKDAEPSQKVSPEEPKQEVPPEKPKQN